MEERDEIRKEYDLLMAQIKDANNRINELREKCIHDDTRYGDYSWRPGSSDQCKICNHCEKVLQVYRPEQYVFGTEL